MKPIKTTMKKIDSDYYIKVPKAIVELMEWQEGNTLIVPFHEIEKITPEELETIEDYQEKITINLRGKERVITRKEIIDLLENPTRDLFIYRTAFIPWKGQKFGSKAIIKKLIGHGDFNTIEAEWYLRQLGFKPSRPSKI